MKDENENGTYEPKVPTKEKFALSKIKLVKDGGIEVIYEVTEVIGNESYTNKLHVESAKDIHPDLRKLFNQLRPIMGRVFNVTSYLSMVESPDFKATKAQKDLARNFADECLDNIEVRGVSLSGQGDNVGVVLTGLFTVNNGMKTAINSPRMKFDVESFGFEEELENIVSAIEEESYKFLYEGKRAQLSLFGADGEATPEALPYQDAEIVTDEGTNDGCANPD